MLLNHTYGSFIFMFRKTFLFIFIGQKVVRINKIQNNRSIRNQSWVFTGRTDVEAETPILWPPDVKSWLIGKDPDAGKDWGQEEKGTTEDEMVGWHHWLNGQGLGELRELVMDREAWHVAVHGGTESRTRLSNWTELNWMDATNILELVLVLSHSSHVQLCDSCWTVALQTPLSMEFTRQVSWSALPFSPPGDLPDPGIESRSPALQADSLPSDPPGKQYLSITKYLLI